MIEVVIQIPERLMARCGPARLRQTQVRFDADREHWFDATVREFSAQSDPVTRTFDLVVGLKPPSDLTVFPGMTATVKAEIPTSMGLSEKGQGTALVPVEAVSSNAGGDTYVWVVERNGGPPHKTKVLVGSLREDGIEILSGLQPGQLVAVAGLRALRKDIPVRPMIAGKKGLDG